MPCRGRVAIWSQSSSLASIIVTAMVGRLPVMSDDPDGTDNSKSGLKRVNAFKFTPEFEHSMRITVGYGGPARSQAREL